MLCHVLAQQLRLGVCIEEQQGLDYLEFFIFLSPLEDDSFQKAITTVFLFLL